MSDTKGSDTDPALLAEVVAELERAEMIILAMLNVMSDEQKALVHRQLQAAYIVDDAMTRHHERRDVIERATAALKAPRTR